MVASACLLLAGSAPAQTTQPASQAATAAAGETSTTSTTVATAEKPTVDALEEFIQKTKHPVPWFTWGADIRLREVFTPNLLLDKEDRHFQRYRERVWASVTPIEDLSFNTRLVYEPRHFCQPSREAYTRDAAYIDEWTMGEGIFDQMNVQWRKAFGQPLTMTVGRQDIILGDGWLVLDGTPLDGSRTIFFDAARGTYEAKSISTTFDLIYICQHADSDYWLPPFCDQDFHNIEQNEKGVIAWVANKSIPATEIDGYFIYKHDDKVIGGLPNDHVAPWQAGTDADIYTFGGRVAGGVGDHWKYRAEMAGQFGNKDGRTLCAQGFNSLLSYFFKDAINNNVRVGYEYLSGDKPGTDTDEQFDPLWGRWPQFSELLAYTVALENRPGETTNLHRAGFGWSCNPIKNLEWKNDYNLLFRDQKSYTGRAYFDQGCFRGSLLSSVLKYKFNDHVSTHLWTEFFFPGDFYSDKNNEVGAFLRYEIVFAW